MIKVLLKSIREYKVATILTPLFVTFEVVLECIIPFIMSRLINEMTGESLDPIIKYGSILIVIAFMSLYCGIRSGKEGALAGSGFAKNLRKDLFYKIQDFSFGDIDLFSTSSLVTRMTTDVTNVQNAFQMIIRIAVRTPLMLIFSVIMTFQINQKMAMIFIYIIPFVTIGIIIMMSVTMPLFKKIFKKYDNMNNSIQENVSGIRVVKSFVREEYEQEKFEKISGEVCSDFTYAEKILALSNPLMMFSMYVSMLLVDFFGARLIINSGNTEFTTGELSSLITYGVQILISMMMLAMVFVMCSMAEESSRRIVEVLTHDSSLVSPVNGIKTVKNGNIKFINVSFKYSDKSEKYSLSDINVDIKSGQTVGIIGTTGSSKTTFIQLISRLYDTTVGVVEVGDVDVKNYDLEVLRDNVAVVLQKNVLFSGTIKDNLRWGKLDATDVEIEHVCKLAQASEFIEQLPGKYDYMISQGGTNVSGGQKQRLCIARALLKKPKVLILDDSTSAVDTKTDSLIRKSFREEIPDTTKIIIAQRISSVEDADIIYVFDGGKIAEMGTHSELLSKNGIYKEVYDSQTKNQ